MKPVHERTGAHLHVLGGAHPANPDAAGYIQQCKDLARRLDLGGAVGFADSYLPDSEVLRRLRASDVIVMNYQSRRFESSGAAMIALSTGRPLISSAVPTFEFSRPSLTKLPSITTSPRRSSTPSPIRTSAVALRRNLAKYEKTARWDVIARRLCGIYAGVVAAPPAA